MTSFPLALVEDQVPGHPTSVPPGSALRAPDREAALTSDMIALRSLITSGCSPDLLPIEKLHPTSKLLKPRAGVTQDWRDDFEESVSYLHRSRVLVEGHVISFDDLLARLATSNVQLTTEAAQRMYMTIEMNMVLQKTGKENKPEVLINLRMDM